MYIPGILKLLPLQGDRVAYVITQGDALGWELLPFQGVLLLELLDLQTILEPHAKLQYSISTFCFVCKQRVLFFAFR